MIRICWCCFTLVFLLFFSGTNTSYGETISRCASTSNELILCLDEAAGSADDYVIQIVKGSYTGQFVYTSTNLSDITIKGGYTSQATPCDTPPDPEPDPAETILNGTSSARVLGMVTTNTTGPANFSIDSITIQNGEGVQAGGLHIDGEEINVSLENTHILNNIRGGVYISTRGDINLTGNMISGTSNGRGVELTGYSRRVDIIGNTITDNSDTDGAGVGMFVYTPSKSVTVTGNTINNNESRQAGGALYVCAQGVLIENNVITHNAGGGLCSVPWWTDYDYNITEIKSNSILHNSNGPGIRFDVTSTAQVFFDEIILTNNIIAYNAAGHSIRGGGVYFTGSHPDHTTTLTNNTIIGNSSPGNGGGVKVTTRSDEHNYYFYSNIIMNNIGSGIGDDIHINNDEDEDYIYSSVTILNNNFDQSSTGFFIAEPAYALQLDPTNLNNQAPLFVNAAADDFHLASGSPCINSGSNDALELPIYDREAAARIMDGVVDMGSFEYPGEILPVALFSADTVEGVIPLTVNFSDESIGEVTTWEWGFGDDSFSSEQNPSHTYNEAGLFSVSLTVNGPNGKTTKTMDHFIAVDLAPPVAEAGPDRAIAQTNITFDGSNSNDVDGSIVSYEWTVIHHNEPAYNQNAIGVSPELSNLQPGLYDVELTITDNDGLTGSDTCLLSVTEPWDVNSDQKLGLEEAIHILRVITGDE